MSIIKRFFTLLICALLAYSMCGCSSAGQAETVIVPTPTAASAEPAPEPTPVPTPQIDLQAQTAEMSAVLDLIDGDCRPGTAGCSLVAVRLASQLLNWAQSTQLSDEQVAKLAGQWLSDRGYGEQSDFNRKLDLVYSAYLSLITAGSKDLMDSAGVDYAEGTWGYEPVAAVEALESAVGTSYVVY